MGKNRVGQAQPELLPPQGEVVNPDKDLAEVQGLGDCRECAFSGVVEDEVRFGDLLQGDGGLLKLLEGAVPDSTQDFRVVDFNFFDLFLLLTFLILFTLFDFLLHHLGLLLLLLLPLLIHQLLLQPHNGLLICN